MSNPLDSIVDRHRRMHEAAVELRRIFSEFPDLLVALLSMRDCEALDLANPTRTPPPTNGDSRDLVQPPPQQFGEKSAAIRRAVLSQGGEFTGPQIADGLQDVCRSHVRQVLGRMARAGEVIAIKGGCVGQGVATVWRKAEAKPPVPAPAAAPEHRPGVGADTRE